jgi:YfiH family protein
MPAARVRFTTVGDGDLSIASAPGALQQRRRAIVDLPWTWLRQVHGADVVVVHEPGAEAGVEADAAVTDVPGAVLAVHTADCVPVALLSDGAVGVAHAGWRGLAAGVVEAAVDALRQLSSGPISAHIGPAIRPRCYEFGEADARHVAERVGPSVLATTAWGTPALDVAAGVRAELARCGIEVIRDDGTCTACSPCHFSYRARGDAGRQAALAWLEPHARTRTAAP